MPFPPPPPPAPPPLPFLGGKGSSSQGTKASKSQPNRNALLSEIRKGTRLKNVETNDRSGPIIDGSAGNKTPSSRGSAANSCKTNGPSPLIPPGGLFAYGMPKLRPTVPKGDVSEGPSSFLHSMKQNENLFSPVAALNSNETVGSRSQPPSPATKIRQMQGVHRSLTETAGCRQFPSDVNVKGPAPAPPPAHQKPNFNADLGARNKQAGVRRSSSQTSLGPKVRPARPPPNIRPPPPPKSSAVLNSAPPPPPSKPPNVMRRQSFGMGDTTFMMNYDGSRFASKLSVPPPPPRNNSAPNSLNQVPNSSPTSVHVNKMTTAPPPPPSRPAVGNIRAPVVRPPPPPVRALAPPPPPPPHRFIAQPTPSMQQRNHSSAPPPPTRVSSVCSSSHFSDVAQDFESRFINKFQSIRNLPPPDKFTNMHKVYNSRLLREKSVRRQPPPPPPTINGTANSPRGLPLSHQPVLHIQLESRIFANNTAHC